ncbi:glycosyltransferase family 2 protein [Ammoniphilus resinae]|uniref:GT2 family glycosyltransferase n=1 Tax=Ammoniphilus resinae TaxID=861532 RepID=A0ABS4GKV1_9BACL|nr:glycosyltransferase [Ammoniphilus resinae]MBP1930896.1 GT2 family glycosyltransferase [Ammoniphilus resinae]
MGIEVSVVIVSYNRFPLNKNTLFSLKTQNFDQSRFEVILVDDASTDRTPTLRKDHYPFSFRYVRNSRNLGRARSRNVGIKMARGKVIMFLDAEAIVEPNCIERHYEYHRKYKRAVVTGGSFYKIYSYLLPGFKIWQRKSIEDFMMRNDAFKKRVQKKLQKQLSDSEFPHVIRSLTKPVKLIENEDIKNIYALRELSEPRIYERELINKLGTKLEQCPVSWLYCIGLNHSIKMSFIQEVGGYDEYFKGWGSEDYEFGYRLTKAGACYIADENLHIFHQEHPIQPSLKREEARNMVYFQKKHPVMDVCIKSLQYVDQNDASFLNSAVREYYRLSEEYPGRFNLFKDSMLKMLQTMPRLVSQNAWPTTDLLEKTGIRSDFKWVYRLLKERYFIVSTGKYPHLIKVFDTLVEI